MPGQKSTELYLNLHTLPTKVTAKVATLAITYHRGRSRLYMYQVSQVIEPLYPHSEKRVMVVCLDHGMSPDPGPSAGRPSGNDITL